MKLRVHVPQDLEAFMQGATCLGLPASLQQWLELCRALGLHWPHYEALRLLSVDEAARGITYSSSETAWLVSVGINPRAAMQEVRLSCSSLGLKGFAIRPSVQSASALIVELPDEQLTEILRKHWEGICK